jgi:hypothetical protein
MGERVPLRIRLTGGASRPQRRGRISVGYDGEAGVELEHTGGNLQIDGPAQRLRCGVKGVEEGGGRRGCSDICDWGARLGGRGSASTLRRISAFAAPTATRHMRCGA